jgi:short-subunit dehydrogenase
MRSLEGNIIVVTGAAGGIGSAVVAQLRAAGARVIGVARSPMDECENIVADLGTLAGIEALSTTLAGMRIDTLVNLAGVQYFGPYEDQSEASLWTSYVVNLVAPAMLARAVVPGMKRSGCGRIVNIGSVFGAIPFAHFVTYSSTKAGLKGLSDALRRELADSGIEVTHIAPRAVRTSLPSPQVMAFAAETRMHMDEPAVVATKIVHAIADGKPNVVIGFPERLFIQLNAIAPRLVDRALAKNDRKAAALFH